MSLQKIHTATTADWTFMDHPGAVRALTAAARRLAEQYSLEVEDCEQDAFLWAGVRPGPVGRHLATENWGQLSQDAYSGMSKARSRQVRNEVSYEEMFGEEE